MNQNSQRLEQEKKGTLGELCRHKTIVRNLLLMVVLWMSTTFSAYIIYFYVKYIPGSVFLNTSMSSVAEPIAYLICALILFRIPLKRAMLLFYTMSLLFAILLFYDATWIIVVLVFVAKFGNTAQFNLIYLGNTWLFPSMFLSTSFGICNLAGRMAAIVSPMVSEMKHPLPTIIYSATMLIAIASASALKMPKVSAEEEFNKSG